MVRLVNIMDVDFINTDMDEMVTILDDRLDRELKTFVVTANPEIVMYANEHQGYKDLLKKADFVIPDGIGIIIASKILGTPLKERVPGFDIMGRLLQLANNKGYNIFLLGSKEEVIEAATANIKKKFSNISIVGSHNGFFDWNDKALISLIKDSKPDIVFVGLGYPRQENWINENMSSYDKGLFIGVGGSFDVWSGKVKRAPLFWRRLNLEWFYRLIKQPSRWKRMLALPIFIFTIIKIKNKRINK